jgi:hypothetical protein
MDDDLKERFSYHPPKPGQPELYQEIRDRAGELAQFIRDNTPGCREQSLAHTHLDEVVFWANAAIARNA